MNSGEKLFGFTVSRVRRVDELNATLVEMVHDKTGAELCWMDNGEDNKLFCVGFKTLPENSTGVFHILEHSVLCGSKKYPVREPFLDLLKSSMNTFLNAMTFPDKTIYPVSSRNEKDFLNLTSVYLDAVFAPRLMEDPNIFYQEGWHTELNDGVPSYKGVVFNEMKGAMSGVDDIVSQEVQELLFPDNCYRFNSGGDPKVIPDLSYEQYKDTYQRFYHPSNSRFFLDGNVPLDATLRMIDEYLSAYERSDETHVIAMQEPRTGSSTCYYEVGEGEDLSNKVVYSTGKIIGTWADRDKLMAAEVLCDLLADSNDSPLKRAILSAGLAEDVELAVMDGVAQPYLIFVARNTSEKNIGAIRETVHQLVSDLLKQGLDRGALEACLNRYAFRLRQEREPQGLLHAINALSSWLYGGDPLLYLVHDDAIAHLTEMLDNGGYETLLKDMLLDEDGVVSLCALPSTTYGAELRQRENDRLQAEMEARSEAENEAIVELNRRLSTWQQTPDSPEQLATLPVLPLSEVSENPEKVETEVSCVDGVTVLHHKIPSKGINYMSLYFSLADCTCEELTALSLMPKLLSVLPTDRYSVTQLQQEIKTHIGSLQFRIAAYSKPNEREMCTPYLCVHASVLEGSWNKAIEIICEILLHTHFDEPDRIREIAVQINEENKQMAVMAGHALGMYAAMSHYSAQGVVTEVVDGYTNMQWYHSFTKHFDEQVGNVAALMQRVRERNICRSRLIASITTAKNVDFAPLFSQLPVGEPTVEKVAYISELPMRLGIRIPAQASFAVQGYHLGMDGMAGSGSMDVATNILSLSYLWNEIRVQGGAYGTGIRSTTEGAVVSYSYRDPSPDRSLAIYAGSADFLKDYCDGDEDLDKFIISTIAGTEPLIGPGERGVKADGRWFSGYTYEKQQETRRQMLATTRESLAELCDALKAVSDKGAVCVVGHEEGLKQCRDLEIVDV